MERKFVSGRRRVLEARFLEEAGEAPAREMRKFVRPAGVVVGGELVGGKK